MQSSGNPWEILIQSENLRLGIGAHRNSEENNTSKKNDANLNESLRILSGSENICLGINLSKKKSILERPKKKGLSNTGENSHNSKNETDISK